jgi:Flp pilus assembly protein TadD
MNAPLRLALACAAALLISPLLFAADPWDGPPFSAEPKALLDAAGKVKAGNADLVLLLDEGNYSVEPDGRTRTRSHLVYRVVTAQGVEQLDSTGSRWQPWYDERPEIRARVIGPDGSVHTLDPKAVTEASAELERSIFSDERVLHAPLPGVSAGAVVEIAIEHVGKSVLPGAGTSGVFMFGGELAVEHSRITLEGPAGFEPHIVNKAGVEPRIVEKDGRKQFVFEHGHTDADDTEEGYLPSDELLYPYVAFSTGTSWSELARGYAEVVDKQIAAADVREIAAATARGATKREEIADRLLAYVEANVHYAGVEVGDGSIVPRVPSGVLKNKYGDCKDKATLLVALLRAAGLPAHVALLQAGFDFDVRNELPALNHFNHAIVVVGGETPLWIDPTDEFARAGALPEEDQGRMALIAAPETTSLTRTPELPSTATRYAETRTFTLPEEGKAHVVEVTTASASNEAAMRRYRAETEADKYKTVMEKYAKAYYFARTFDKLTATDPRDLTQPFTLTLEVSDSKSGIVNLGDAAVAINLNHLISPVPSAIRDWDEKRAADTATPAKKRKHDFVFPSPFVKEWTYRVILPPGFKARTLPQDEAAQLGTTMLSKQYSIDSHGAVVAKFRFDSGKRRLTPGEFESTRVSLSKAIDQSIHLGFDSIGQAKLNAGDVRGALDEFRRLAALHPKEAQHHRELARALMSGGLGEAAREEARRAVAIEPNSARAHFTLGAILEHDLLGRAFHTGFDLAGALAEVRKAVQLDGTDLEHRVELAALLTYGDDGFRFGRGNRLAEAIDEYKKLFKEFGADAKAYEPRLMVLYAHAGRWDEMKAFLGTMEDGEQKNLGRLLHTAATSGVDAATRELDAYGGDTRRQYAEKVGETLMALGRYPESAAMMEISVQGGASNAQTAPVIAALKKARRGAPIDDSPTGTVLQMFRAFLNEDDAALRRLLPGVRNLTGSVFHGVSPRAVPMGELTPDELCDLIVAMAEVQTEGSDAVGYRVRMRVFAGVGRNNSAMYLQRDGAKYVIRATDNMVGEIGPVALKLAATGNLDAARTWLNWAREEIPAGGGDDPLSGAPFASLWPKDKAAATADEIRLAAAALAAGSDAKKESVPLLLAARGAATDEQKKWIDVALLYAAVGDTQTFAEAGERLAKSNPDSAFAFTSWTLGLVRSGKIAEAEAAAKQRLERSPRNREALEMLINLAAQRHDYDAAAAYAKRVLDELTPLDNDYNEAAWIALFNGKELDKAIENAQRATTGSGRGAAASLHTLAALYAERGKNLEARQALVQSLERRIADTLSPNDWYVVGRIAENYGVPEAAVAAYKRVEKPGADGTPGIEQPLSSWELSQRRLAALNGK